MAERPLKVLFVSHRANLRGGAQRSLLTFLQHMDRRLIQPTVLLPGDGPLADALAEADIPVLVEHYEPWVSKRENPLKNWLKAGWHMVFNMAAYALLYQRLRGYDFDAIYTNTLTIHAGAWLAGTRRCPHIWHARELVEEGLNAVYDMGIARSMRLIDRSTTRVISNSHAVQARLTAYIPAEKCRVIYNGFPELDALRDMPPHALPDPSRRLRLGMVGRVAVYKGQLEAVHALHRLVNQHGVDAELWLVGHRDFAYAEQVRQTVTALNIADRVLWKEFTPDTGTVYREIDIALSCSHSEAFGRVVVEALAHGCPVIGADSGGIGEIITDGENGLLYPLGDPGALAAQVVKLAGQDGLYTRIASAAFGSVYPRFSLQQYVEQLTETILEAAYAG